MKLALSVRESTFVDILSTRSRRFSELGLRALYHYYDALEDSTFVEITLDVIETRSRWYEYYDFDLITVYGYLTGVEDPNIDQTLEALRRKTTVIKVPRPLLMDNKYLVETF